MTPYSIYNHSRLSFLLILVGTIIAGIFIVFTSGNSSATTGFKKIKTIKTEETFTPSKEKIFTKKEEKQLPAENTPKEEDSTNIQTHEENTIQNQSIPEKEEEAVVQENDSIPQEEAELLWNEDEIFSDDKDETENDDESGLDIIDQLEQQNQELSEDDFFDTTTDSDSNNDDTSTENSTSDSIFTNDAESETKTLSFEDNFSSDEDTETESYEEPPVIDTQVSPVTNLALESSLEQKLDEDISQGTPVTLSLIKINGLDRGNSISDGIISILKNKLEDIQLFEYKADGYAIILKGTELQPAVDAFEEIYNRTTDFLKENNATNEVSLGISSTCERKVNAERIILEAGQALEYAAQDPESPIVAFRANPQKYQDFIENQ